MTFPGCGIDRMPQLTIDDVTRFVARNKGVTLVTLADACPFTVHTTRTGIGISLPPLAVSDFGMNRRRIGEYIAVFDGEPERRRRLTSIYRSNWRERSYMARVRVDACDQLLFEEDQIRILQQRGKGRFEQECLGRPRRPTFPYH